MKFGTFLIQNQIPEWKEFYINYNLLKIFLVPIKKNYKHIQLQEHYNPKALTTDQDDLSKNLIDRDLSESDDFKFQTKFENQILTEIKKVEYFYSNNFKFYKGKLVKINEQLEFIKTNKEYKDYSERLEIALKELYKEMIHLKDFIELNLKAKTKIMKKFKKLTKFSNIKIDLEKKIEEYIQESEFLSSPIKKINEIKIEIEKCFFSNFFTKYSQNTTHVLKEYVNTNYLTQSQSFYLGFFIGILFFLFSVCCLISYDYNIDMDDDYHFKSIFPMFRGYGIICLFLWLLGLNVYTWNIFNINYKLCFDFNNHYSDAISIFQRAACFTSILLLMVLFYMIIRTQIPVFFFLLKYIPLEILPLICWIVLLIYLFFPVKNSFNYQGRLYTLKLLTESILSIFNKIDFRHVWFTDQMTSFIGPLRDAEYTLCYYVHFNSTFEERKLNCSSTRNVVLFIGIFPNFIRILQCFRIIIDTKKFYPQIWNSGKYSCAILAAVFSFFVNIYPELYPLWWITAIISTIYSFFWDMKFDFGFLEGGENYPLRKKLSYNNKYFYYVLIVINLFLRFMWVLSTSPEIVFLWIRPEFVSLIIFSMEIIRRGFWNFIRVELKHIELCKEFKVTNDVELPFKKIENGEFILKNTSILDILKINRRLDKIKAFSLVNDIIKMDNKDDADLLKYAAKKMKSFNTKKSYDNTQFRADLTNYIEEYEKNSTNQVFSHEKIVEKQLFIKEGYLEKENKISMEVVNEDLEYHELGKIKSDDSRSFYYKYEDSLKDSRKNSHLV